MYYILPIMGIVFFTIQLLIYIKSEEKMNFKLFLEHNFIILILYLLGGGLFYLMRISLNKSIVLGSIFIILGIGEFVILYLNRNKGFKFDPVLKDRINLVLLEKMQSIVKLYMSIFLIVLGILLFL